MIEGRLSKHINMHVNIRTFLFGSDIFDIIGVTVLFSSAKIQYLLCFLRNSKCIDFKRRKLYNHINQHMNLHNFIFWFAGFRHKWSYAPFKYEKFFFPFFTSFAKLKKSFAAKGLKFNIHIN